jgi:gentisate 1,2-dioxygenase
MKRDTFMEMNPLLPSQAATSAAKKVVKKLPKKSKNRKESSPITRQTRIDSTENVSSQMKATARSATPPADEKYVNKKSGGYMKKMGGGYMKKMKKGGKTGKYNCSHNRLY